MPSFDAAPTPPSSESSFFVGMDRDRYPGDDVMTALKRNTNLSWTGFYLTPAPSQGHALGWMGKHDFLRGLGWGLAPVYVGRQIHLIPRTDHRVSAENGTADGRNAALLARQANFTAGAMLYLDFEHGPGLPEEFPPPKRGEAPRIGARLVREYFKAWAESVRQQGFKAGVYCSAANAIQMLRAVPDTDLWTVNLSRIKKQSKAPFASPSPAESGAPAATLWQYNQALTIEFQTVNGLKNRLVPVDLNSSDTPDPSGIVRQKKPTEPRLIPRN